MTLDIFLLAIFALLVFLGWRSGALGQALRVVAAAAVVLGTAPASTLLREAMYPDETVAAPLLEVGSMFLAAVLIYAGVSIAGVIAIKILRHTSDTLSNLDRAGGAALGALKASLLVYVLAALAVLLQGPLEHVDADDRLHMRDGQVTAFVERHDILAPWRFPDVERLSAALRVAHAAANSRRAARELRDHDEAADFLRREAFSALLEHEELLEAARTGRVPLVLAHEHARSFLNERDLVDALRAVDWEEVEQELGTAPTPPEEKSGEDAPAPDAKKKSTDAEK